MMRLRSMCLAGILAILTVTAVSAGPLYTITGLGQNVFAVSVNNLGVVVGVDSNVGQAFMWINGKMTYLPNAPGDTGARANGINDVGTVVGVSSGRRSHAVLWQDGKLKDLGIPTGYISSEAIAVSRDGQVIANAYTSTDHWSSSPFIWANGVWTRLSPKVGWVGGINDRGQVVGSFYYENINGPTGQLAVRHAFLWDNGSFTDLGLLAGKDVVSEAFGINYAGKVVGYFQDPNLKTDPHEHACLWQHGEMTDISKSDLIQYPLITWAAGVNNLGEIIGGSHITNSGQGSPMLWHDDFMVDENPGSNSTDEGDAINDAGYILTYDGTESFLSTPYPPQDMSMIPNGGVFRVATKYVFTSTYLDANWQYIGNVYLVINSAKVRTNAAYVKYNSQENRLYVRNDSDTSWIGGYAPGSNIVIENSSCQLFCKETTISASGNQLSVNWSILFKPTMAGKSCGAWMKAFDNQNRTIDFQQMGSSILVTK